MELEQGYVVELYYVNIGIHGQYVHNIRSTSKFVLKS